MRRIVTQARATVSEILGLSEQQNHGSQSPIRESPLTAFRRRRPSFCHYRVSERPQDSSYIHDGAHTMRHLMVNHLPHRSGNF